LQACIREHPDWSRHRITQHLCEQWDWRTHAGQLKTFAARSFIDKLEAVREQEPTGLLLLQNRHLCHSRYLRYPWRS